MFSGIVQAACSIVSLDRTETSATLVVDLGAALCENLAMGASVAVDGVCLTVVELRGTHAVFNVILGTLQRSILPFYCVGQLVNIERSLKQGDEIGGHEVSGHVDCRGTVQSITTEHDNTCLTIALEPEWRRYIFPRGFVAINGVSLTVSDKTDDAFSIWLIPETLRRTNLSALKAGDVVNVEIHRATQVMVDIIYAAVQSALGEKK